VLPFGVVAKATKGILSELEIALTSPFQGSRHLRPDGRFEPPFGFYDDPYIRGYIHGFVFLTLKIAFPRIQSSDLKKGEVILGVYQVTRDFPGFQLYTAMASW
jgi:hypothetical protein